MEAYSEKTLFSTKSLKDPLHPHKQFQLYNTTKDLQYTRYKCTTPQLALVLDAITLISDFVMEVK
jgi:hypothetical protein